jgi:hypothetical protein
MKCGIGASGTEEKPLGNCSLTQVKEEIGM